MAEATALIETAQKEIPSFFYNPADQVLSKPGISNVDLISSVRKQALIEQNKWPKEKGTLIENLGTLDWSLQQTDPKIGQRFMSLGVEGIDPVRTLDKILSEETDRKNAFKSTPFMEVPMGSSPVTDGGIMLFSAIDGGLHTREDIKYIALGREYMRVVDLFRKTYPNVKFIPWNEIPIILKTIDMGNPKNTKPSSSSNNQLKRAS